MKSKLMMFIALAMLVGSEVIGYYLFQGNPQYLIVSSFSLYTALLQMNLIDVLEKL